MKRLLFMVLGLSLMSPMVRASEVIEFPEEELARESVLPIFDQPEAVKKRFVPMDERWEFNGFLGVSLNDPWYNAYPVGGKIAYHFNELHSVGILGALFSSGQTSYVGQIQTTVPAGQTVPFDRAPAPKYMGLLEYEFTPFYGKISITKQRVMNITIAGTFALGTMGLTSSSGNDTSVDVAAGLSQRFFFTRNFGLKADIRAMFYSQDDPILQTISKKQMINVLVTAGVVYFIPSL